MGHIIHKYNQFGDNMPLEMKIQFPQITQIFADKHSGSEKISEISGKQFNVDHI
jgi:hypothetical protein